MAHATLIDCGENWWMTKQNLHLAESLQTLHIQWIGILLKACGLVVDAFSHHQ